jgi:hypothetical protein
MYAGSTFSCTLLQLQTMPPPMRFHLADWEGTMCGLTAQAHARSCACPLASCWWCFSVVLRQRRCRRLPVPIGCFNLGLETLVLDAPLACFSTSAMRTPAGGLVMHSRDSQAPRHWNSCPLPQQLSAKPSLYVWHGMSLARRWQES